MKTQQQVLELIRNGENSYLELKEDLVQNDKLAIEVIAFSNLKGATFSFF